VAKRAIAIANANAHGHIESHGYINVYGNANAFAIAKAYANANAIAKVYANANANAFAFAFSIAKAYANPNVEAIADANAIANANIIAITNANVTAFAFANTIADTITYTRELEELKVFKAINFTVLIARLEALKAKVSDDKQPKEVPRAFAKQILQTLLKAFRLNPELVNLSEEEAEAWKNYFYANYLMMQCKEAAVRVSPKTWEAIEERMLLVPNN
jgi:hypothetical protein